MCQALFRSWGYDGGKKREFGSHEGYSESEVGGSENQLPTAGVV